MTALTAITSPPAPPTDAVDILIIIGSSRPGRRGPDVARWMTNEIARRNEFRFEVLDVAELDLPAVLPADDDPRSTEIIRQVGRADGFVVVTPEYNHGYPASLKQAIDIPYAEWNAKPVAFVSYGGAAGGIRAVEQLRQVFAELHAVTLRNGVSFPGIKVDAEGAAEDPDATTAAGTAMLDDLLWWSEALRDARRQHAYRS